MGTLKYKGQFFNRELSWLQFNRRVQVEADNPQNPLLERAKFLGIVTSNLDEFLQVRYHRVLEAADRGADNDPSGLSSQEIKRRVQKGVLHQSNMQYMLYEGLLSELYMGGIRLYPTFALSEEQTAQVIGDFESELLPLLQPITVGDAQAAAALPQKWQHLCVALVHRKTGAQRLLSIPLPPSLPRVKRLQGGDDSFILLEDQVKLGLHRLFPEESAAYVCAYRFLRNQDFDTEHEELSMEHSVREMLRKRRTGKVLRFECDARMPEAMQRRLMAWLGARDEALYRVTGPLDLNKLMMKLYSLIDRPELKYKREPEESLPELMGEDIFQKIAAQDHFLFHPYYSFDPVVHFVQCAAKDEQVRAIKQTLYRVSDDSPIVHALEEAAQRGKQVVVLFEARARFDEENNLYWGERLQRAGCRVLYGLKGTKTHSKITLVNRAEGDTIRHYLHLGTGNYHDGTAHIYTDMGLLTADEQLGEDAVSFFHQLEGYPTTPPLQELVKAPDMLKKKLLSLIAREKQHAENGDKCGITAKMNGLVDTDVIAALYDASQAGVPIRLIVRGICCLKPGVKGLSESIHVISIVGRHLEHARAFRFENGGSEEVYLSSADWMPRNLVKRVELMFPVKDDEVADEVTNVLALQLSDNEKAWVLDSEGLYTRVQAGTRMPVNAQEELLQDAEGVLHGRCHFSEAFTDFSM